MDANYETILETGDLIWTMLVYLVHVVIVFIQASLACFLLGTGAHTLWMPELDRNWLRRLGAIPSGSASTAGAGTRWFGSLRLVLGMSLLAPIAIGVPDSLSLLGSVVALALLVLVEWRVSDEDGLRGRRTRRTAVAFAVICSLFMAWEGEDNLVLGADLFGHALEWRAEEIAWQQSLDPKSPKVGDLAPDFELQDPQGEVRVRLSDFRGKRPVALIFGSYT